MMNSRVEELAHKMVRARHIRDEWQQMQHAKYSLAHNRMTSQENFFKRKADQAEREVAEKERRIKEMEQREAELIQKIKTTQSVHIKEFN